MQEITWTPGIGDPSIVGWFTVLMYFLSALGAYALYKNAQSIFNKNEHLHRIFWAGVFLLMLAMGINKQLDLQSLLTDVARYLSHKQGWHEHRGYVQRLFIYAVLALGGASLCVTVFVFRSIAKTNSIAILGVAVVTIFVVSRAASFHHMDVFIGSRFLGVKINWVLELGGISLILMNILLIYCPRRVFSPKE